MVKYVKLCFTDITVAGTAAAVGLFVLNHRLVALKSDRLTPFLFVTYANKNKYNNYHIGSKIFLYTDSFKDCI
jgi:hypothetical protein